LNLLSINNFLNQIPKIEENQLIPGHISGEIPRLFALSKRGNRPKMEKKFCDSVTQKTTNNDVGGKMKAQIDPGPSDKCGNDVKNNSVTGKPRGQKGCHHECTEGVSTGEARVKNFSLTFGKLSDRFQKYQWPFTIDEEFNAVDDCRLDGVEKKEIEENFFSLRQNPGQ
jgi:hypothetical protein